MTQTGDLYRQAAEPVLTFTDDLEWRLRRGEAALLGETEALLERFESDLLRLGAPNATLKPARYGLGVLIDTTARTSTNLSLSEWSAIAPRALFDGRDMSIARVRDFRATADKQGGDFNGLSEFLSEIISMVETRRDAHARREPERWGTWIAGFLVLLAGSVVVYAAFVEYRFHARILATFETETAELNRRLQDEEYDLPAVLDEMRAAKQRVASAASDAPLARLLRLPLVDSATRSEEVYSEWVGTHVPNAISLAINTVLETEGDGLKLYDTLRAWSVLTGETDWSPAYLAGWLEDYGEVGGAAGLHLHIEPLEGPVDLTPNDPELMKQARIFAAEVSETDRAWLELTRSPEVRSLPAFHPVREIAFLEETVFRRSGAPISTPLPGLVTQEGWTYARDFATGVAVRDARRLAPLVLGLSPTTRNDTPDLLLDRLHRETLSAWDEWLADLRVRPLTDRRTAVIISGILSRAENPLTHLFQRVWFEVGGTDRSRSHEMQLAIAREFGPLIQYVEAGRMSQITQLFSALNVALGALDTDFRRGEQRLMGVTDRARSISALNAAPRIVVQIAEDALVQSAGASRIEATRNPLLRDWQQNAFPACIGLVQSSYPFTDGRDASLADVAGLLGPSGILPTFIRQNALPFLEIEESPWRWKPEARFEGLSEESAPLLERIMQISEGLFGGRESPDWSMTLAALAERGQTTVTVGGQSRPVRASGAPAVLAWPGPEPTLGAEVRFQDGGGTGAITSSGAFGLMRIMDGLKLRMRDDGRRVLLDLRSETGRVFLEIAFESELNPISVLPLVEGFRCPPSL